MLTGTLVALTLAALGAGAARAQVTLPNGSSPLPGSNFQGRDGNQDDAPPLVDWQGPQAAGRVLHNPDSGLQFSGGDKELEPGLWTLIPEPADGVNPAKDNIFDAWSSVDQTSAQTFLYLAFTREKGNGTTTIAFDLNQDARLWDNDGNPSTPKIPCRTSGDMLVVFDAHGNDDLMDVHLERWTTVTADSGTGCARTGSLTPYLTTSIPLNSAQAWSTRGPITSHLPGHFPPGTQIPEARLFGEAALNLTELFKAATGSPCFSFASTWMHSRASESVTSAMKDYLAPKP